MLKFWLAEVSISAKEIGLPTSTANVGEALTNITRILMSVVGALAVIFLIVGGILMALSNGDAKRVQQARDTIRYAIAGIVVSLVALAIVSFVASSIKSGN